MPYMVNIEFITEEIDDMSDPEPFGINHEDTEQQTGFCPFLSLNFCFSSCEI